MDSELTLERRAGQQSDVTVEIWSDQVGPWSRLPRIGLKSRVERMQDNPFVGKSRAKGGKLTVSRVDLSGKFKPKSDWAGKQLTSSWLLQKCTRVWNLSQFAPELFVPPVTTLRNKSSFWIQIFYPKRCFKIIWWQHLYLAQPLQLGHPRTSKSTLSLKVLYLGLKQKQRSV